MLKFDGYLKESAENGLKFNKDDYVIYVGNSFREYKGKDCDVVVTPKNPNVFPYMIKFDDGETKPAMEDELRKGNQIEYQNRLNDKKTKMNESESDSFKVGDEVYFITNRHGLTNYNNEVAEVKEVLTPYKYVIRFKSLGKEIEAFFTELKRTSRVKSVSTVVPIVDVVKFKKGDKVIYNTKKDDYNKRHNGKEAVIIYVFSDNEFRLLSNENDYIFAKKDELTLVDESKDLEIKIGDRVVVDNPQYGINYGVVLRINYKPNKDVDTYFIKFSPPNNQSAFSMLVDKKFVKFVSRNENKDDKVDKKLKKGDSVLCLKPGDFFNKIGEVSTIYNDGISISFKVNYGTISLLLDPDQFERLGSSFTDKKDKDIVNGKQEEEEESVVEVLTKEDLLEMTYEDFFLEGSVLVSKKDMDDKIKNYENIIGSDVPEFKKEFYERSLKTAELVVQYFEFLEAKVAMPVESGEESKDVMRVLGDITDEVLIETSTKIRASESKEITKKYSFDRGVIAYWEFADAVVFKTI